MSYKEKCIKAAQEKIAELRGHIADLEAQISTTEGRIADLNKDITKLEISGEIDSDVLLRTIEDFPSNKILSLLNYHGIDTVGKLVSVTSDYVYCFRGAGPKTISQLEEWMQKHGLKFTGRFLIEFEGAPISALVKYGIWDLKALTSLTLEEFDCKIVYSDIKKQILDWMEEKDLKFANMEISDKIDSDVLLNNVEDFPSMLIRPLRYYLGVRTIGDLLSLTYKILLKTHLFSVDELQLIEFWMHQHNLEFSGKILMEFKGGPVIPLLQNGFWDLNSLTRLDRQEFLATVHEKDVKEILEWMSQAGVYLRNE